MADDKEKLIGRISHYYPKVGVGIIDLSDGVTVGDTLHYKGTHTDFEEEISSLQIEHESVQSAKTGDVVGVKVSEKVREGDQVYKK